jgi:tetratricopeptide (TPR) repeat protein
MGLLSGFNPHELPEATVYAVATGREDDLQAILRDVRSNIGAETRQHLIVSGPRGFGKSFLMRHIQLELQRKARDAGWNVAVAIMPEEMPHVREPETLIREITRTFEGGQGDSAELSWHEDDGAAWDSAVDALEAAVARQLGDGGLLVALVENFDVVLRNAFPKTVHASRLREFLTRKGGQVMFITASATGAFDRDYDKPLFQAFKEVALVPWGVEQCLAFFDRQRAAAGRTNLEGAMLARAQAVASFIGGTPRLATLLGDALLDEDVLRAADLLQRLVDELTPYYKERVEALPGRSQKLLDALLRFGEPATQSELARRVNANSQAAIAGPFSTLVQERIVTGVKAPGSAEVLYRVADRVFAHFYRRRTIAHGNQACALEALVELLAEYFTPDEMKARIADFAHKGLIEEARLLARLHAHETGQGRDPKQWILLSLRDYYVPRRLAPVASASVAAALRHCAGLAVAGRLDDSRKALKEAECEAAGPSDRVVCLLARARLDAAEGLDGGLAAAEEALRRSVPGSASQILALIGKTWSLGQLQRHEEAISTGQEAAALAMAAGDQSGQAVALGHVAWNLGQLQRHEEAMSTGQEAAALAIAGGDHSEQAEALREVVWNLGQLQRHEEAIRTGHEAAALAVAAGDQGEQAVALGQVAWNLGQLQRHEEAISTGQQAAALAMAAGDQGEQAVALGQVAWNLGQLQRHEEAISTGREAAALAIAAGDLREQAEALSYIAWNLGRLRRHEEAISTGQEAAALAIAAGDLREQAEALRHVAWSLGQLHRHEEAMEMARAAAAVATKFGDTEQSVRAYALAVWIGLQTTPEPHWNTWELSHVARLLDDKMWKDLRLAIKTTADRFGERMADLARTVDTWHHVFTDLQDKLSDTTYGGVLVGWIVESMANSMMRKTESPDRLDLAAQVIDLHFPGRFAADTGWLRAAARYHQSGRDPAMLARIDPDVARTLRIMFPPKDGPQPGKKRQKT